MQQRTRWSPDTCDCVINILWNDADPPENRQHTREIVRTCAIHQGQSTPAEVVYEENTRKNKAIGKVSERRPDITPEQVRWSFDQDRKVILENERLTAGDRTVLRGQFDDEFGPNRATVL